MNSKSIPPAEDRPKYSWLRLAETSDKSSRSMKEPNVKTVMGRPRRSFPLTHTSVDLTASDMEAIEKFQQILNLAFGRKTSRGEVFGFLANVCNTRVDNLGLSEEKFQDIVSFADALIGKNE